jgi:enoyl-CoA hydratase
MSEAGEHHKAHDEAHDEGQAICTIDGAVAQVVFDRAEAHNAMTWKMYAQLEAFCERVAGDPSVRVMTLRGRGGRAFVAGTDIQQFLEFSTPDDGVRYEARIEEVIGKLDAVPVPTVAIVDGWCVGGGLAIAANCDYRIATPAAKFGVPIARTLGNCLSIRNTARLVAEFGVGRTKRMLMFGDMIDVAQAHASGFVSEIVEPDALDARAAAIVERFTQNAPLTMRAAKQSIARVLDAATLQGDDLVRLCYGSADFHEGVKSFVEKRPGQWRGE